jgi:hypothetical protein
LKCLQLEIVRLKDEDNEQFEQRQARVTQCYSSSREIEKIKQMLWELQESETGQPQSITGSGTPNPGDSVTHEGIGFSARILAARIRSSPPMRRLVTDIIFGILFYLYCEGEIGLANSIWQSIRTDCLSAEQDSETDEIPDEVGDWLFSPTTIASDPWELLQLDDEHEGGFHSNWFIDHIMRDGFLWVGRYTDSPHTRPILQQSATLGTGEESPEGNNSAEMHMSDEELRFANTGEGHLNNVAAMRFEKQPAPTDPKILQRQRMLLMQMLFTMGVDIDDEPGASEMSLSSRRLAVLSDVTHRGTFERGTEDRRKRELVAAFEVHGPCLIAIPFDYD